MSHQGRDSLLTSPELAQNLFSFLLHRECRKQTNLLRAWRSMHHYIGRSRSYGLANVAPSLTWFVAKCICFKKQKKCLEKIFAYSSIGSFVRHDICKQRLMSSRKSNGDTVLYEFRKLDFRVQHCQIQLHPFIFFPHCTLLPRIFKYTACDTFQQVSSAC